MEGLKITLYAIGFVVVLGTVAATIGWLHRRFPRPTKAALVLAAFAYIERCL